MEMTPMAENLLPKILRFLKVSCKEKKFFVIGPKVEKPRRRLKEF
jgi:hypothetical protein